MGMELDCSAASFSIWAGTTILRRKTNTGAYRQVAQAMAGRMVVVRTLDIGADKQASYFALPPGGKPGYGDAGHPHLPDQAPDIPHPTPGSVPGFGPRQSGHYVPYDHLLWRRYAR